MSEMLSSRALAPVAFVVVVGSVMLMRKEMEDTLEKIGSERSIVRVSDASAVWVKLEPIFTKPAPRLYCTV